jgi:hypothetical protein
MIPVQTYATAADMRAAHSAIRARLMGAPRREVRPTPRPEAVVKPPAIPKGTGAWTAMTPGQKCAVVKLHWREGISTSDLAQRISRDLGEPVTRRAIVGVYYRNNKGRLKDIAFTVKGGGQVGDLRPRKTWPPDEVAAQKRRSRLIALLNDKDSDIDDVISAASEWVGYGVADIKSTARHGEISTARQAIMWLLKKYLSKTAKQIGRALGGRSRPTVLHGCGRINGLIKAKSSRVSYLFDLIEGLAATGDPRVSDLKQWVGEA